MRQYFGRKLLIYFITFFLAVSIDWLIPRFMPGNPVQGMIARANLSAEICQDDLQLLYASLRLEYSHLATIS